MPDTRSKSVSPWLVALACIVAVFGVAALWAGASLVLRSQVGWFAVVAALDAILILRLAGWPEGRQRVGLALAVTLATILIANAMIATAQIGNAMGLRLAEALPRMSVELAALHARSNTGAIELVFYLVAIAVAWRLGR
jgi:hypothetical protein